MKLFKIKYYYLLTFFLNVKLVAVNFDYRAEFVSSRKINSTIGFVPSLKNHDFLRNMHIIQNYYKDKDKYKYKRFNRALEVVDEIWLNGMASMSGYDIYANDSK